MDGADVGDHGDVGRGDAGEGPDLAGRAHAHLEDGRLVGRIEPEERQGQAEGVVVVPLGPEDPEPGSQERGRELLGRRLADAAGHADDLDRPADQDLPGQGLESLHRVPDQDEAEGRIGDRDRPADDGTGGAAPGRGGDEIVSVAPARDGEEQAARGDRPRIEAVAAEAARGRPLEDRAAGGPGDLLEPPFGHGQEPSVPRSVSSTTSTSLKRTVRSLKIW
jgi:hypothetical protein